MNVFMAGPRAITFLHESVLNEIDNMIKNEYSFIIGDANGVDKALQKYLLHKKYSNVTIYACKGNLRNNLNNWDVKFINTENHKNGFDAYAQKDKAMVDNADMGFMIWNGKSKGTLNNIVNLLDRKIKTLLFYTPDENLKQIASFEQLDALLYNKSDEAFLILYEKFKRETRRKYQIDNSFDLYKALNQKSDNSYSKVK